MTTEPHLPGVWEFLSPRRLRPGNQGYIVYPVIENRNLNWKAAMEEYEHLSKEAFPKLKSWPVA